MATVAIRIRHLAKSYAGGPAVRGLDLTVPSGEIFGFLGPNGAGKSTTLAMLCTLTRPSSGQARVAGHDVVAQPREVRRRIGMLFQDTTVDGELTAEENLLFHAALHALPPKHARRRVGELLDFVQLTEERRTPVRVLSGGMRRRLEIARATLHRPAVLFLDEPTTGLDPVSRTRVWEHLHQLRDTAGTTVFLTTHYMDEAEHCDSLAIIDHGRLITQGSPAGLKAQLGPDRIEITTCDPAATATRLRTLGLRVTTADHAVTVHSTGGAALLPRLCTALDGPIRALTLRGPSLDDVFLHHTGHALREQASP